MKISDAELDELNLYLHDIADSTPLSREKEVELAARIQAGDTEARNELAEANLLFVITVAKQYQHRGLSLAELISAGNWGLMAAVDRFDGTRGFKFISYAVWWIRQSILQTIAEQSRTVRLPLNRLGLLRKIYGHLDGEDRELTGEADLERAAEALGASVEEVRDTFLNGRRAVSLDAPSIEGDDARPLVERTPNESAEDPDEDLLRHELQSQIQDALARLVPREAEILRLYFGLDGGDPMTLEAIGAHMNLTRERIRQIKEKGLAHLRNPAKGLFPIAQEAGIAVADP